MSDLTVTIERDPFRREHIEGAPGAYQAIIHTTGFRSKTLLLATGSTETYARLRAASELRQLVNLLEEGGARR